MMKIEIKQNFFIPQMTIEAGRINVFIGGNGSGKTALLRTIGASIEISDINRPINSFLIREGIDQCCENDEIIDVLESLFHHSVGAGFDSIRFIIGLIISDYPFKEIGIDDFGGTLSPIVACDVINEIYQLCQKYDKTIFIATHNPSVLDGIDLTDDEQRLFFVSRNKQGETRIRRITLENKPRSSTDEELKLSEAFLRGYLGRF